MSLEERKRILNEVAQEALAKDQAQEGGAGQPVTSGDADTSQPTDGKAGGAEVGTAGGDDAQTPSLPTLPPMQGEAPADNPDAELPPHPLMNLGR